MRQSLLEQAMEKIALAGERAGISIEDMIQLLNAGVSVVTLLDFIELHLPTPEQETGSSSRWIM